MYVLVRLLKGFPKPLFYKIPQKFIFNDLTNKIALVPLKNTILPALILRIHKNLPNNIKFEIKEIIDIQNFPQDQYYHSFIKKISEFYFLEPLYFYQRIRNFLFKSNNKNIPLSISYEKEQKEEKNLLTQEQQQILNFIEKFIDKKIFSPTLLHGVTSSGKTEIYKKLIIKSINQNQSVILLLPEVSLSLQFQFLL